MRTSLVFLAAALPGCFALAPPQRSSSVPPFYRLAFADGAMAEARTVSPLFVGGGVGAASSLAASGRIRCTPTPLPA